MVYVVNVSLDVEGDVIRLMVQYSDGTTKTEEYPLQYMTGGAE